MVMCGLVVCVCAERCEDQILPYYCDYYASVGYCVYQYVAYMEENCPETCG